MSEERKAYAESMFTKHPSLFSEGHRASVLSGVVELGMTPFEAHLAGGAFSYKVVADASKWPDNADPLKVMWAQSTDVDDSEIWMMFNNATQFSERGLVNFRVYFMRGRAVKIEKQGV